MPTYTYSCKSCDRVFEVFKDMGTDESRLKCPHCEGDQLKRVYLSCNCMTNTNSSSGYGGG